ncbi:hypothetical protein PU560_07700 [Georgenia sp. 10Sc9-8]|uniref:DUF1129 family protein n=1 Tax=Georgenia halotolerans TaxID=3028317 RepID=A0ABT5TZP8_9MICO|nr:hypothetical protein [Georgenia halotolerans]
MMSTANRRSAKRYSFEHELAPHIDGKWAEDLILELRLREVPGPEIGKVLAEADSHCADSGQSAQDTFGDPVAYARSLDLPAEPSSPASLVGAAAPALAQVLGMLGLLWSFGDLRRGEPLQLTTGYLATAGLLLAAVVLLVLFTDRVLRAVVHRPVVVWCAFMLSTALFVVLALLLDHVVVSLPAGWGVAGGTAVLVAGLAWELIARRRGGAAAEDPIRSPFGGTADGATTSQRWAVAASRLVVPIWTVVVLALMWWSTS